MERNSGTGRSAEAQAFARAMSELKERSGRSYGALARGLHTSTSTLHRYCSGEALPAEFAVVDRFARACGATPAEAVELHRAWLLADARRWAVAVAQAPPVDRADGSADAEPDVPGAPAVRRSGRRLLLAGVAVATVVALAVGVRWLPETGPDHRAPEAGPTAQTGATGTAATPTETGPATGGPSPAAPPLRAAVRSHVWAAGCDHAYLAESAPSAVPPPPVEADAPSWAAERRAVHAGTQIVEITLMGTGPETAVLEGLDVRVAGRRSPLPWNVYEMSQGCGGGLTPAGFAVNLDAPRPLARPVTGNNEGEKIEAPAFPIRVSASEPAVLRVVASSTGCDCDWSLDLRWSGPTGSGTLRLDEGGRPWRVSAVPSDRPVYGYASERGRWGR